MSPPRAPIVIRLRFNKESGQIEELSVDDRSPLAPEAYHDEIARTVAARLDPGATIVDAFLQEAALHELEDAEETEEARAVPSSDGEREG